MKKLILLILWLVFLTGCQTQTTRYIHCHNERFDFELDYPSFMTMDPPPENGDGISCHGKGLELTATGGLDMTWMDLDDTGLTTRDLSFPQHGQWRHHPHITTHLPTRASRLNDSPLYFEQFLLSWQ